MAISTSINDREYNKFKESTTTSGQPGVVVLNPDGSNVGGGGAADQSTFTSATSLDQVVAGVYQSSPDTITSGKSAAIAIDQNRNVKTSMSTGLTRTNDEVMSYPHGTTYKQISASTLIVTGTGQLTGIFVSAASATPTIKVWDNTSGATTVLIDTFTPVAGTSYQLPNANFNTGCFVTISGTVSCTVFTAP